MLGRLGLGVRLVDRQQDLVLQLLVRCLRFLNVLARALPLTAGALEERPHRHRDADKGVALVRAAVRLELPRFDAAGDVGQPARERQHPARLRPLDAQLRGPQLGPHPDRQMLQLLVGPAERRAVPLLRQLIGGVEWQVQDVGEVRLGDVLLLGRLVELDVHLRALDLGLQDVLKRGLVGFVAPARGLGELFEQRPDFLECRARLLRQVELVVRLFQVPDDVPLLLLVLLEGHLGVAERHLAAEDECRRERDGLGDHVLVVGAPAEVEEVRLAFDVDADHGVVRQPGGDDAAPRGLIGAFLRLEAGALAHRLVDEGWQVGGTRRLGLDRRSRQRQCDSNG